MRNCKRVWFKTPVSDETLGIPPYNPFIVIIHGVDADRRNRDLHLTNHISTDKASWEWFGKYHDKSVPPATLYISDNNYPFAINVPIHNFKLAPESGKIDDAYPDFYKWATSNGTVNQDWYMNPAP